MPEKPLIIKLREARESITKSVNMAIKNGIPCFLLESIVAELHMQVSKASQVEYEQALKQQAEQEKKGDAPK